MWLTSFLSKEKSGLKAAKGNITASHERKVQVNASTQYRDVPVVAPYGIAYVPPVGEGAVIVPYEGGEACVGVIASQPVNLQRGELMLYSAGGASIVLRNDGSVLINGNKVG